MDFLQTPFYSQEWCVIMLIKQQRVQIILGFLKPSAMSALEFFYYNPFLLQSVILISMHK